VSHPLDPLIETITQSPDCSVSLTTGPWSPPRALPEDLNYFCSKISGGDLFYRDDPNVPQVGCSLAFAFAEPVYSFPDDGFRADYPRLDTLFEVAYDPEAAEYSYVCVDLHPSRFGRMYYAAYDLGDPEPFLQLAGRSFTEWLQALVDAGELHREDWRAALQQYRDRCQEIKALTEPIDEVD